jgi:hypothetical protein
LTLAKRAGKARAEAVRSQITDGRWRNSIWSRPTMT